MCTVVVVNHHHKEFPLVIAANRDEDFNRPSSGVQVLAREPHLIIGGKDDAKGGTWLGVNKQSIFVAITNQGEKNQKLESRGRLVLEALKYKTLEELLVFIEELNPAIYNKFNLVFGNNKTVYIAHSYLLHSMVVRELPQGVHVISNDMKFVGEFPKVQYIHAKLDEASGLPWAEYYKTLKKVLASSDKGIKLKPRRKSESSKAVSGYCTRSSSILAFSDEGLARYKFHDRTAPRQKKKDGDPITPRYKDYVDIWRNPDAAVASSSADSEDDDIEDGIEESLKDKMLRIKFGVEKTQAGIKHGSPGGWGEWSKHEDDDS